MMTTLITIIHIVVCFTLIAVILLQAGRGQGLTGASFGSGNVQSLFGTRAGDFLTKATTVAAIGFMLTCLALDFIEVRRSRSLFSVQQPGAAPMDIEQIRKALEKIKSEGLSAEGEAQEAAGLADAVADEAVLDAGTVSAGVDEQLSQAADL